MKALIFDMDGLMIDSEKFYFQVEREIGNDCGANVTDELLMRLMGRSPRNAADIFIKELNLQITPEEFLTKRDLMMEDKYRNELEPMRGLFEIINTFENRLKLAIATGSPEKFLNIVIDKLEIRDNFNVLVPSDNIKNGKPDPEIYLETIKRLKVKPEECIVLEDSSNGAKAGKLAGCHTIVVLNEYTKDQNFDFADFVCNNLFEAKEYIEKIILVKREILYGRN
jgi:HAD superfamily hydrolase (TIGR01509 family)